jgi:hypothetical protein
VTSRPRLLILSFSDISADARVLKQVRRFVTQYDVTTCGFGPAPDAGVRHLRIPDGRTIDQRNRNDLILRRYRRMYWSLPGIAHVMSVLPSEPRFDVVLANDIDTVGVAMALEPTGGVHADIHEYAPRQNEELLLWRIFVAPYVRWMCRNFLTKSDSVTTVGKGVADEYRRVFDVQAGVVTNAAPYADLEPGPVGSPIRLVHSGAALRNRHLEVTVSAVLASSADLSLDLFLMPNDPAYIEELRGLAGDDGRVRVRDPLPYAQLIETLNEYDAGIHVIPPTNFNNRWSLPNKFFDYVQARLALVIGPSAEMRQVLQRHDLGAVAAGFGIDEVRASLDGLTQDAVAAWKANAASAARELSAEEQIEGWARAVDALAARVRDAG